MNDVSFFWPYRYACPSIVSTINDTVGDDEPWSSFYLKLDLLARAQDVSAFINCIASPYVASSGFTNLTYDGWRSPTSGTVDFTPIQEMSYNATYLQMSNMDQIPTSIVESMTTSFNYIIAEGKALNTVIVSNNQADEIDNQTELVVYNLQQSGSLAVLETVTLEQSNFETNDSCQYLAQLADKATSLATLTIAPQVGNRQVQLDITYATSDAAGTITVSDVSSGVTIYSMSTQRTAVIEITNP